MTAARQNVMTEFLSIKGREVGPGRPCFIVAEAGISLLGLGVQTPGSSIGLMISQAQNLVSSHPWEILLPAGVLAIIVLCFSFFGDGLRDAFDPRSKD